MMIDRVPRCAGWDSGDRDLFELIASEQRWRSLMDHAPDFIFIVDSELNIEYLNRTVPGQVETNVVGRPVVRFASPRERPRIKNILRSVLETGQSTEYVLNAKVAVVR